MCLWKWPLDSGRLTLFDLPDLPRCQKIIQDVRLSVSVLSPHRHLSFQPPPRPS